MFPIKLIGFEKEFSFDNSYEEIPKYWDEICEKYCTRINAGEEPTTQEEHAIVDCKYDRAGITNKDIEILMSLS